MLPEPRTAAPLVVTRDPAGGQHPPLLVEHGEGQLVPGGEADLPGHAGLVHAHAIPGPLPGQVEAGIDQGVALVRDVSQVDAELTVLEFAQAAAPLAGDADGLLALLD